MNSKGLLPVYGDDPTFVAASTTVASRLLPVYGDDPLVSMSARSRIYGDDPTSAGVAVSFPTYGDDPPISGQPSGSSMPFPYLRG